VLSSSQNSILKTFFSNFLCLLLMILLGMILPRWLLSLITISTSYFLVVLGIIILMRNGVVAFGQGLVFAIGGYASALAFIKLNITDALSLVIGSGLLAAIISFPFSILISRYRGIFFAMLSLALSMVLYGLLIKSSFLGGWDGFNMGRVTFFGWLPSDEWNSFFQYVLAITTAGIIGAFVKIYFDSKRGILCLAAKQNEIRLEYLGTSAKNLISTNFVIAAFTGGVGGSLAVISIGHVDPNFTFWTTSGDFVFIAILAGHHTILAAFIASFLLEIVRSFSNLYFPNSWQLSLGIFLLIIIRFLPEGIGSIWQKKFWKKKYEKK